MDRHANYPHLTDMFLLRNSSARGGAVYLCSDGLRVLGLCNQHWSVGFQSEWQPQRCSVLLRADNSLLHFCCVSVHTQLLILELAFCAGSCKGRVQKERLCKRAWQGVCAERETCDPEVPPPQPLKGQRFGSGSEKFSHSWLLVQLSRVYKTYGGGEDWDWGLENRTRFKRPVFSSSLCRVFYFPPCLHLPTCIPL